MCEGPEQQDFYAGVLGQMLRESILTQESSILVVCGGETDCQVLKALGFRHVTISNADKRITEGGVNHFPLYESTQQDAESLTFGDGSFEWVIVHSGLHHLRCPQKGLAEMYRVASRGVLGFEPNRNVFTTLGVKLGFGQEYETAAVFYNDCQRGGVVNSAIPNYTYRFSKQDIARAIQVFAPIAKHSIRFWFTTRIPGRLYKLKNPVFGKIVGVLKTVLVTAGQKFPFLANNMAFLVVKPQIPRDLFPWLKWEGNQVVPNKEYLNRMYKPL